MISPQNLIQKKQRNEPISMITCYDATFARLVADTDMDCILVGDSASMVVHGHDSTVPATVDMMVMHTQAVRRGAPEAFIVGDLPFFSIQISAEHAMQSVQQLMQAGANAVKCEGGHPKMAEQIHDITSAGVAVMGHLGLTPQSVHQLGGHKLQGKTEAAQTALLEAAKRLEAAGCFAIVLECVPESLAKMISETLSIPTIGIGAGRYTDGQVLVLYDMLGLSGDFCPKFLRRFSEGGVDFKTALQTYHQAVTQRTYPAKTEVYQALEVVTA